MFKQKYLKYKSKYLELKNQIGGDGKADVTAFAGEKGMSLTEFHNFLINVSYYKKNKSAYDDKGIHNPMIIGNYVVRSIGGRSGHTGIDYSLQVRPKEKTDTPEALIRMADVPNDVFIDNNHDSKYIGIHRYSA